jgi:cytochrome bd-type quinol oxidase subunit 1
MIVAAFSRPFWPLFLHVLGAMTTVGAILTVVILSYVAWSRPEAAFLRRATFITLLTAIPFYVLLRVFAEVMYSDEKDAFAGNDPTWVGIGYITSDAGFLLLLITIGLAFWWKRSGKPVAGRIVAVLSTLLLLLLTVAMLAMSGKWGS